MQESSSITVANREVGSAMGVVERDERIFELAQRRAKVYASSTMVPKHYQGQSGIANVIIAQNMAERMGADLLMVMQNLYIVHGSPGWSAKFLIATFNACGRFSAMKFRYVGEKGTDDWGCVAYATEKETGDVIEGPEVTIGIAKAEGWHDKNGSKWKTIPQLMLCYRAATFLVRIAAPEVGMGLMTKEELDDIGSPGSDQKRLRSSDIIDALPSGPPATPSWFKDCEAILHESDDPKAIDEAWKKIDGSDEVPPADAKRLGKLFNERMKEFVQ